MRWPWQYGVMNVVIYNPFSTEHLKVFYNVQMTNYMHVQNKHSSIIQLNRLCYVTGCQWNHSTFKYSGNVACQFHLGLAH